MNATFDRQHAVDTDTALAELYEAGWKISATLSGAIDGLHYSLRERLMGAGRGRSPRRWPTSTPEAEAQIRAKIADPLTMPWQRSEMEKQLVRIERLRAEWDEIRTRELPLIAEYDRLRWPRFFLVTSSSGGHIHRDMHCSTCYPDTRYAWLPQLSGLTEADAVAAKGPLLCSVCYPSAPLEWTIGETKRVDPRVCPGTSQFVAGRGRVACPVCSTWVGRSASGLIRRHYRRITAVS
jgi:hypothetical protein